jgi:regulator of sigma E protease
MVLLIAAFKAYGEDSGVVLVSAISSPPSSIAAELKVDDIVRSVNGTLVASVSDIQSQICADGSPVDIGIERDGHHLLVKGDHEYCGLGLWLGFTDGAEMLGTSLAIISIQASRNTISLRTAIASGFKETWIVMTHSLDAFAILLPGTTYQHRDFVAASRSRPSERLRFGHPSMLLFHFGVFSIWLACLNVMPFPPLDGGQLLLCGFEAIRGKPISKRLLNNVYRLGLALIVVFGIIVLSKSMI